MSARAKGPDRPKPAAPLPPPPVGPGEAQPPAAQGALPAQQNSDPREPPAEPEPAAAESEGGFPELRDVARALLALRRRAKTLAIAVQRVSRRRRHAGRELLQRSFELETSLEEGLTDLRSRRRAYQGLRRLDDEMAAYLGEPRELDGLDPDGLLPHRAALSLAGDRPFRPPVLRLRWPLQYDLYRFEVLGGSLFAMVDLFEAQERRTRSCLELIGQADFLREHQTRERDVDLDDRELALPRRRSPPPTPNRRW